MKNRSTLRSSMPCRKHRASSVPSLILAALGPLTMAACEAPQFTWPEQTAIDPKYADLVPFRGGHLAPRQGDMWLEMDPSLRREELVASLSRMRTTGVRQVLVTAPYTFTGEPKIDKIYEGFASGNVIYRAATPEMRPFPYGSCQRGDMGVAPADTPASWALRGVHWDFAASDPALNFPGPFVTPAAPSQLLVTFGNGWDGGAVTIEGINEAGATIRETVPAVTGPQPTVARYRRVTSAVKQRRGTSNATVTIGAELSLAQVQARAERILGDLLALVKAERLLPVLVVRYGTSPAHPAQCSLCQNDGDCFVDGWPVESRCVRDQMGDGAGLCKVAEGTAAYLDPSRDPSPGFDQFFTRVGEHTVTMTRLAAQAGAGLIVLGGGAPYLSGAGEATFADNSQMTSRRAALTAGWQKVIALAKAVPGRPRLTYAAQNLFIEGRLRKQPERPEWDRVGFWQDLDLVGVDFFQPGRQGVQGQLDYGKRDVTDMIRFMESRGIDTDQVFGSLKDLQLFTRRNNFSVKDRPVLLLTDGVPAVPYGAAQPFYTPPTAGDPADFEEQRNFVLARLTVVGEQVQQGWLGGIGLWPFQANLGPRVSAVPGQSGPSYGGQQKAQLRGEDRGFNLRLDYFALFDTPSESVVQRYFCPIGKTCQ